MQGPRRGGGESPRYWSPSEAESGVRTGVQRLQQGSLSKAKTGNFRFDVSSFSKQETFLYRLASVSISLKSCLHLQSAVGGIYECGTVDLPQNQQGAHLMSLRCKKQKKSKCSENSHSFGDGSARLCQGGPSEGAEELVPCCRPGAGQCSCSHPTVSGQPWPGEGGWLDDTKAFVSSQHRL